MIPTRSGRVTTNLLARLRLKAVFTENGFGKHSSERVGSANRSIWSNVVADRIDVMDSTAVVLVVVVDRSCGVLRPLQHCVHCWQRWTSVVAIPASSILCRCREVDCWRLLPSLMREHNGDVGHIHQQELLAKVVVIEGKKEWYWRFFVRDMCSELRELREKVKKMENERNKPAIQRSQMKGNMEVEDEADNHQNWRCERRNHQGCAEIGGQCTLEASKEVLRGLAEMLNTFNKIGSKHVQRNERCQTKWMDGRLKDKLRKNWNWSWRFEHSEQVKRQWCVALKAWMTLRFSGQIFEMAAAQAWQQFAVIKGELSKARRVSQGMRQEDSQTALEGAEGVIGRRAENTSHGLPVAGVRNHGVLRCFCLWSDWFPNVAHATVMEVRSSCSGEGKPKAGRRRILTNMKTKQHLEESPEPDKGCQFFGDTFFLFASFFWVDTKFYWEYNFFWDTKNFFRDTERKCWQKFQNIIRISTIQNILWKKSVLGREREGNDLF